MAWFQDGQGNNREVNDPESQCNLGDKYHYGDGVTQDYNEAVKWYRLAAEQGYSNAQNKLGFMYDEGLGVQQDYPEAIKWYRLAAEQGYSKAQNNLGIMYENGNGVKQDDSEAIRWYRLAAEQGFPDAQYSLGLLYANGLGVKQDYSEALKWYRLAADQGFPEAQNNLGLMYDNDLGVKQDYLEALKWYRKAADQGFPIAQFNLGLMHEKGHGVPRDYKKALKWFRLAADQGLDQAQASLGSRYLLGNGVKKDLKLAFFWNNKAAEQGNSWGQYDLALMYEYGEGVIANRQKALEWYMKAADQGDDEAQRCVGVYCLHGLYSPLDIEEALKWFQKSADQGNVEAKRCLDHVLKTQAELEVIRNKIEPQYFRVAQLLRQVSRISTSPRQQEMWGWFKQGERPSKREANKFFLTCILDYQMKVEFVWSNTEKFVEQTLGDPEDLWEFICGHTLDAWKQKKKEYKLHRFESGHIRVWKIGRDLIQHYGGDARAVWEGHEPAAILERLYQLGDGKYGVGEIIANMIVGALIDTEQIKGVGDVKADTHVRKILGRVFRGYSFGTDEARECTEFARKIYPPNPWLIDNPLFLLGQEICREKNPDCPNCYLRQECMYRKKKSLR